MKIFLALQLHSQKKSRLNLGNACYFSIHNLLTSHFIFKSIKIKKYKAIILPVVLYSLANIAVNLQILQNGRSP
jgi:hypothetical protein